MKKQLKNVLPAAPAMLTEAEEIEKSLSSYRSYHPSGRLTADTPVPERRQLQIGQAVRYGAHENCIVAALHMEGRLVTVKHTKSKAVGLNPGREYSTVHWTSIHNVVNGPTAFSVDNDVTRALTFTNTSIDSLVLRMVEGGLVDDADYQRGYAWSDEDKDRYIDTLFAGGAPGSFIVVRRGGLKPDQVLDGKQRLNALVEVYTSQRSYRGTYWEDMSFRDQHHVLNRMIGCCTVREEELGRAKLLEMFLLVNSAGVPQTAEHLAKVEELLAQERAKLA